LHTISNILFKLLALENKYNKNKLLNLDKIDNFATNIKIVTKLMQQTLKEKLNLIVKKRLFEIYIKFIK